MYHFYSTVHYEIPLSRSAHLSIIAGNAVGASCDGGDLPGGFMPGRPVRCVCAKRNLKRVGFCELRCAYVFMFMLTPPLLTPCPHAEPGGDVVLLDEAMFESRVLKSNEFWVIEWYADWCGGVCV